MSERTEIASLGEFGLIEHLTRENETRNVSTVLSIGDDAAVIDTFGKQMVVTTDMLVEGVHFNERFPIKYISNGIELKESIRKHYYMVLDIHSSPIINGDVVFEKYQKHIQYLKEDSYGSCISYNHKFQPISHVRQDHLNMSPLKVIFLSSCNKYM